MTAGLQRGPGMLFPNLMQVPNANAANGVGFSALPGGPLSLPAGAAIHIPAGAYRVQPGPYSQMQVKDPITGLWSTISQQTNLDTTVVSDGQNYRICNLSGCAIGGFITNVGSGYTSAPVVTASSGASTWTAIVGGAVNATVTITTAGTGYLFPPILFIDPPPAGGIQATATCTISAGAINAVTVVNQGAGYATVPLITIVNDPRDTAGSGGVLTINATLAGAQTITGLLCTGRGTPLTSVPTLTFTGGGGSAAAATVVMCFTATGFTVSNGGAVYGNAQPFLVLAAGGVVPGSAGANINPQLDRSLLVPRMGVITGTSTAGGAVTATGAVIADGGLFEAVPTGFIVASGTGALPTTTAIVVITVGGVTDTSYIYPTG